jgi:DNA-binding NarL/FixJ family response regulator
MKLMIVEQHVLFRQGLISLLKDQSDIDIVGSNGSVGPEIVTQALAYKPDVVLMDANIFEEYGREMMSIVLSNQPKTVFLILGSNESKDLFLDAVQNGASGYLPNNISKSILLTSLRALERGEAAIPRAMVSNIIEEFHRMAKVTSTSKIDIDTLSFREVEVLRLIATEATNIEIARRLSISENTVKIHVRNILDKLHVRKRREAAEFARRLGLNGKGVGDPRNGTVV